MSKKHLRTALAAAVLITTGVVFAVYLTHHPEVFRALKAISPVTLIVLFILYGVFTLSLVWIQWATLRLCDLTLGGKESTLVVMYSAIINFFGPLQSGPAFRAAYLKVRHSLSLKRYALATLVYYGLYALFSALLLLTFLIGWWIIVLVVMTFVVAPLALKIKYFKTLDLRGVRQLAFATLSQVIITSIIYFVEIHSLVSSASYIRVLAYTGAANFALFVSLTPGAIGFREAFLLFSQRLHHFDSSTIAAASLIDRSVYIAFLLISAAIIFGMHANDYLKTKQLTKAGTKQ